MKRIASLIALLFAGFLTSCGGNGSSVTPPPPAGNFSNASLNGQYAFSMGGIEAVTGGYTARVGSIAADGNGNITAGLEDVLNLTTGAPPSLLTFSNGTYQIQPNGRGLMTLYVTGGGTLQLSFALNSNAHGLVIQSDGAASTTGTLDLQTPALFAEDSINGKYVFSFSGVSFAGSSPSLISTIGELVGDGNGNITSGTIDVNDGSFAPTGAVALPPGTYQLDTNGNGTNFGRGMMTVNSKTYAFYIVDHTRIKFLEEDASGGSEGEAILQSGAIPTQNSELNGSFVYLSGGSVTSGNFGPISRLGRMSANGAGVVSAVSFDENDDGNNTHISESSNLSDATYSMDANYPGSGRGTFTFHNSSVGTISYVFYFYSPTQAVVQDVSAGVVSGGTMLAQTGAPFTTSSTAGNYIFSWTGIQLVTPAPFAEDFVGQAPQTSTSSNNFGGLADYVELGLNSTNTGVTLNSTISGTLTMNGDGTQDNTYKIAVGGSSGFTINYKAYVANNSTILVLCYDTDRTTSGLMTQQTQ
jgi:hypothetical protein